MSYGEHQEAVGLALVRLLDQAGPAAVTAGREPTVVECRHQALLAVRDRLALLGTTQRPVTRRRADRVEDAGRYPLHVLHRIIDGLHAGDTSGGSISPTTLLPGPPPTHATAAPVDLWRAVARHLLLGNADLDTATEARWHHQDRPAWYLVGDAARTLEALVILSDVPVLPKRRRTDAMLGHRLAASAVARVADWYGTDPAPDLAVASPEATLGVAGGPRIQLIQRPEDFVRAQWALARFLRPARDRRAFGEDPANTADRVGLLAARAITTGQVRLAETFARWAGNTLGGEAFAESFRARIPRYLALHRSTSRLTELRPAHSPLVISQQSELVQRLRRFPTVHLAAAALHDLDAATHRVAVTAGRALRAQGMHHRNILILDTTPSGPPGARPITSTQERFNVACRRLADEPAPPRLPVEVTRAHRTALAASLAAHRPTTHVPSVRRSPSP